MHCSRSPPETSDKVVPRLCHTYQLQKHNSDPKNSWWPQMASDIQRWCDTCIVCATINQGKPGRTKLCRPEPPKGPWELLQLDFIGPLPSAKEGYRYCLVIIDKFSKWVEAIPTRNNSANTVARVVANQILHSGEHQSKLNLTRAHTSQVRWWNKYARWTSNKGFTYHIDRKAQAWWNVPTTQ